MNFKQIENRDVPISLLLEADPSKDSILSYLPESWCFAAVDQNQIVGACVVKPLSPTLAEIYNLAVFPTHQAKGVGSQLLKFVLSELPCKGIKRVELGTGTFGYQLTYYQRAGFRVDAVIKDHFLQNYAEPIFENEIQHKDMLRLYIEI